MWAVADFARHAVRFFLDALYPGRCAACDRTRCDREGAGFFCAACWETRRRISGPRCPGCAAVYPSEAALSHSPQHRCSACHEAPPPFARAITPFVYDGVIAKAIHLFKYDRKTPLAAPLARLILADMEGVAADCVAAIPLHPGRLRMREFNPSLLLAREIARARALPLSIDALERVRETPPQVGLSKSARRENVRNAFGVRRPGEIAGRRILLIDDVYTTGATLKEGAKELIRSGAREVTVATIARTVLS